MTNGVPSQESRGLAPADQEPDSAVGDEKMCALLDNTPVTSYTSERQRRQALAICLIAGSMILLDMSIFNVALPSLQRGLHISPAEVSWSVAGYALTFGLTLIPAGRLGDEYGRRRLFLIGMSLSALTAIVCGAAPDATVLVMGRLCHGVAAGLLAPQVIGLMQQMYPGPKRGRAFGYFGATVGLSAAAGPLLGGIILQVFGAAEGWRLSAMSGACIVRRRRRRAVLVAAGG